MARQVSPRGKLALIVAATAVVSLLAGCTGGGADQDAGSPGDTVAANPVRPGQVLDATYPDLDGTTHSLAELRGKPVVLNFFSQSCAPCKTEMPALEKVKQARGDSVTFVGLDLYDQPKRITALVDQTGVTWNIGQDQRGAILARLGGTGLPITVVLDRSGTVVYSFAGSIVHNLDDLGAALDQAASSAAPAPSAASGAPASGDPA